MSVSHESVGQGVRPGPARVRVTEPSGSESINPTPTPKPNIDPSNALEAYLSPERLEQLCGTSDLSCVKYLELCLNTQENTLGDIGVYLPRLEMLKMNNSLITSLRDLGTTLSHLQVLWMNRCCLQDLSGIFTFSSLKELYLAFNHVSDLSQVAMMENLQLLDLEGNRVDDLIQIHYLGLCPNLHSLSLEGNPVCVRPNPTSLQVEEYNYRAAVRELVPQLRYLDDVKLEEDRVTCCSTTGEHWEILRISMQDSKFFESPGAKPVSSASTRTMSATRHTVLSPFGSRPGSSDSDLPSVEADTSTLTHGTGNILFCGNPVRAVRARRQKLKTAPTRSSLTPCGPPIHVPEHTYDLEEPSSEDRVNVFAELRAWKEQYSKRLDIIEKERSPQILTIHHSGKEETDIEGEEEEEEGFGCMKSRFSDEEQEEDEVCASLDTGSPDSSFQSLSPDIHQQETFFPNIARQSLCPDIPFSPSPPLHAAPAPANMRLPGIRARRFCLSQSKPQHFDPKSLAPLTASAAVEMDLLSERRQHLAGTSYLPVPPRSSPLKGPVKSCADTDMSGLRLTHKQKKTKDPEGPKMSRPHTAEAALQKHYLHHLLQPYRGSSHLD
ncbi:PREDICTED: leucine-rich repeat-containing protein 56 isoform X1 [Cyprinodon variegatus]|uniref:leucine-rich repeat-containing protein 56 isoform X1 n=1 Tax=Cyprinodon variegatus TaxID=28743 RepID=UPI00074274E5|nr:PREDICTED: leucine-rich repeat-containing protein 56 isoform X1 [Cyprinodon variegatus]